MTEIEKFRQKAGEIGLDADVLIGEIGAILTDRIVQAIPSPQLDLEKFQAAIEGKLSKQVETVLGQIKSRLDVIKQEIKDGLDAAIEVKLLQYKDQMVAAVKLAGGPGANGQGGQANPNDRWAQGLQVLDRILDRQDPLANIENLSKIYARLGNIFPGPDPTALYRGNQQLFIEGIKVGAKARGGVANAGPLSSNLPAGRLTRRVKSTSHIDRIIQEL